MARSFNGSTQYGETSSAPFGSTGKTTAMSMSVRVNVTAFAGTGSPNFAESQFFNTKAIANNDFQAGLAFGNTFGSTTGQKRLCVFTGKVGVSLTSVTDSVDRTTATWYATGGTFDGSGNVALFLDGSSIATGAYDGGTATSNAASSPIDIAAQDQPSGGPLFYFNGAVAEGGVWAAVLGARDWSALGNCASPLLVQPSALRGYYQLAGRASPEPDFVKRYNVTLSNSPTQAKHPRVFLPC